MQSTRPATFFFALAILTLLILLSAVLSLMGGKQAEAQAGSGQTSTPKYEVLGVHDAAGVREIDVAAATTDEAGMRLIAQELRQKCDTLKDGTLLIEYAKARDTSVNTGFALAFDSKQAILDAGQSDRYGEVYGKAEAERIMTEEDGVRVVSFKGFTQEHPSLRDEVKNFLS